mmetsp:Transcript_26723/g.42856  ORF Transcript_26723/g.42856 Transcript_26723/m.42856 type:complete len:385 (-) Transcript_26723:550-1704(-)
MVFALEVVGQPGLSAQRQHSRQALHGHLVQPHSLGAQEARALVAQRAGDEVHHGADEDATAEPDAQEQAVHVLGLAQVLHLHQAHTLRGRLQGLRTELLQGPLALQRQDADGIVHSAHGHEGSALAVLGHRLHCQAQHFVVHVALRHLVQRVALVDLEVQNLSARKGNHHLPLVGCGCDDTLLTRHPPLVGTPGKQMPDASGVHLHVRIICHELDEQRRSRGQETTVQNLLDCVADGQHQGHINERHDDVAVKLTVHCGLDCPDCIRLTWQLAHSHLCDCQAVPQHTETGLRASSAHRVQLRLTFASCIQDLHVHNRRQRWHLIVEHEVLQRSRLEGDQCLSSVRVGRCAHWVFLIGTNALELIKGMVAELSSRKQEACLQHAK